MAMCYPHRDVLTSHLPLEQRSCICSPVAATLSDARSSLALVGSLPGRQVPETQDMIACRNNRRRLRKTPGQGSPADAWCVWAGSPRCSLWWEGNSGSSSSSFSHPPHQGKGEGSLTLGRSTPCP